MAILDSGDFVISIFSKRGYRKMNKPLKELLNLNKIVETYFSCYLHLENNNLNIVLKLKTDKIHTVYYCKCDVENMLLELTFNGSTADIIKLDVYIKAIADNAYIKHDSKMFIISDNQVFEY